MSEHKFWTVDIGERLVTGVRGRGFVCITGIGNEPEQTFLDAYNAIYPNGFGDSYVWGLVREIKLSSGPTIKLIHEDLARIVSYIGCQKQKLVHRLRELSQVDVEEMKRNIEQALIREATEKGTGLEITVPASAHNEIWRYLNEEGLRIRSISGTNKKVVFTVNWDHEIN